MNTPVHPASLALVLGSATASGLLPGRLDPELRATVTECVELTYSHGALPGLDLPAHVRAGSGLAWVGDRLAVVQDDTLALGLFHPSEGSVHALALPATDGVRSFSKARGNKAHKPDFEALVALPGDRLVAFGSGSTSGRERLLVIEAAHRGGLGSQISLRPAGRLYAALRALPAFAGSELNVEGAAVHGNLLALLQRGNGAPRGARSPVDALGLLSLDAFEGFLAAPDTAPVPELEVLGYDLGDIEGVRLTFTDAATSPERRGELWFLAAAEASPNTYDDGEVVGSVVGIFAPDGTARHAPLTDGSGERLRLKAEGLALDPRDPSSAWVALDIDDPDRPCQVCRVRLEGAWSFR